MSSRGGISTAASRRGRSRSQTGYRALALSPDGRTAAVGLDDGIQLVDLRTGAVRDGDGGTLAASPNWLLFSPDGKTVVSTSLDGTVTVWDAGRATPRETLRGHSDSVQQPVFSPDGKTLYTASHDGTRDRLGPQRATAGSGDRSRSRTTGGLHHRRDGHPGKFSPDGRLIAVGLKEQGIALWDAQTLDPVGAPLLQTRRRGQVARVQRRTGKTLAAVTGPAASHALGRRVAIAAQGPLRRGSARPSVEHQRGRDDARHGRLRRRRDALGRATGAALGRIGADGDSAAPSPSARPGRSSRSLRRLDEREAPQSLGRRPALAVATLKVTP